MISNFGVHRLKDDLSATGVWAKCESCAQHQFVPITEEQWKQYCSGEGYVQDIFPNLSSGIRELMISGYCSMCWNKLFGEEE